MVSRVFVVTAIVFAGNVFGSEPDKCAPKGPSMFATCGKSGVKVGCANLATAGSIILAQQLVPKNQDAAKAVVETVGVKLGSLANAKPISNEAVAGNFIFNYTARKAGHVLADNGWTVDNTVGKVVGMVPFVGEAASPVVTEAVKAAGPQTIASIILYVLAQYANSSAKIE